jgi:hypothetical protein
MARPFHASLSRTVVSIATAAVAFTVGPGKCLAGDKIEFTVPGNPTLAQKPEREIKPDDAPSADKMDLGAQAPGMAEYAPPPQTETVVIPAERDKRDKLRAWDAKSKPFGLEDRDDLLPADAKPAANNAFTNNYDAKPEWGTPSGLVRGMNRSDNYSEFSNPRTQAQTPGASASRNGMNMFSGFGREQDKDNSSPYSTENDKNPETSGLSAWGKTLSSQKESYSQRLEEYRTLYSPLAPKLDESDTTPKLATSPTPGLGGSSLLGASTELGALGGHGSSQNDLSSFNSGPSLPSFASRYSDALTAPEQNQTQTRPTMAAPVGEGYRPMAAQPIILSFPKKPGSIFQ